MIENYKINLKVRKNINSSQLFLDRDQLVFFSLQSKTSFQFHVKL